ncbi:hypothetical protein PTTG_12012 [Puccinia triticina 1-1 BBBD Race 1]|uniref:SET domain-containing protein n=2 Tax=Puccinia triticina TaxID=208348 RepID=A0A180GZI3_PUCT1|nr:hypothetical protein PTTG_12012 [Puccinia triticina 1-1 BBBD Race 1]
MPGAVNGKPHTNQMASRPSMQPRPSSSINNPIKDTPSEVISISDDEDDQVTVLSAPKSKTHVKRSSSTYDVSSWNVRPKSKHHHGQNSVKDSSSRPILSSSTIRSSVVAQSHGRKNLNTNTSNRQELFSSSQSVGQHHAALSKGKQPILHVREPPKEQPQHARTSNTSPSKGSTNASKTTRPTDVSSTAKSGEFQNTKPARTIKPSNEQSDVVNKLQNCFSHRPSSGSGSSSTRKDQISGPVASTHSKPAADTSNRRHESESSWATSQIKQSMAALQAQRDINRAERERLQSRGNTSASGSALSKGLTTTPNTNTHSAIESSTPHTASGMLSATAKVKDNTLGMRVSNQQDNSSSRDAIEAIFSGISNRLDTSDAPHARKKIKHTNSLQSKKPEDRFLELSDSNFTDPPIPSTSFLPPRQNISNTTSSEPALQPKKGSSTGLVTNNSTSTHDSPCAIHPVAFLPLPRVLPRTRPVSPDWSQIPSHRRPLQGRERPGEFSDELQKTWILNNNPDLSTPLGQLIFTEEINANQMWENPEIPRIDVVVPDEVKAQMLENLKAERQGDKTSGLDQSLAPPLEFIYTDRLVYRNNERPIPPSWHCNCHGDCLNNPNCECRAYQTQMVKQAAAAVDLASDAGVQSFEGFAYVSTRKNRHTHSKKPDNGDTEARCIADIFIQNRFPVFECNSRCGCDSDCINRTVGRGRREKLSIQKTLSRGWGVFADHTIPVGRLVTHYSGEVITDAMSAERGQLKYEKIGRTYIFDLDPWWIKTISTHNLSDDGLFVISSESNKTSETQSVSTSANSVGHQNANRSLATSSSTAKKKHSKSKRQDDEVECIYSVDAFLYGNVARFMNHSCSANTVIVPVYIDDVDPTRPIFAMFASKHLKADMEITTSYSDPNENEVKELDKQIQSTKESQLTRYVECKCGAPNCKRVMFA